MKKLALSIIGLVLVLTSFAFGVTLRSSLDTASISCVEAKAFVWVQNDEGVEKTVALKASLGELNGYFEDSILVLQPNGARGTYFHFSAPDALSGRQDVEITANSCTTDSTSCETKKRTIIVYTTPCKPLGYVLKPKSSGPFFVPPRDVGQSSPLDSDRTAAAYFDSTNYDASFFPEQLSCKSIRVGDSVRVPLTIFNRGAAATFTLNLIGDKPQLNGVLSHAYVSLSRNGMQEVFVDVTASPTHGAGRFWVTAQAMKGFNVIAERDVCIDVEDINEARVLLPPVVRVNTCDLKTIHAAIENAGTSSQGYEITELPSFVSSSMPNVYAGPRESAKFDLFIDGTTLQKGERLLVVKAKTLDVEEKTFVGKTILKVESCAPATPGNVESGVSVREQDSLVRLLVTVANPGDEPLEDVSLSVIGIPSEWIVSAPSGQVIPAGASKEFSVTIDRTTDDSADSPKLLVKSGNQIAATEDLPAIKSRASGLTGFFTAAFMKSSWFILALILAAILFVVLFFRPRMVSEEAVKRRLKKLKSDISEEPAHTGHTNAHSPEERFSHETMTHEHDVHEEHGGHGHDEHAYPVPHGH